MDLRLESNQNLNDTLIKFKEVDLIYQEALEAKKNYINIKNH